MLTKLLFRHLPNHYPPGSAYAHFPFLVPDFIQKALAKHHDSPVDRYNWTRPLPAQLVVVIDDPEGVLQVLSERQKFVSDHDARVFRLTKGAVLDHNLVSPFCLL
jgi:linoleate 10R-lipoxygenase